MSAPGACPDTGTCHHGCPGAETGKGLPCLRVLTCVPLAVAGYPRDRWPHEVHAEHQQADDDRLLDALPAEGRRVVRLMAAGGWATGRPSRAAVNRTIEVLGLSFADEQVRGEPRAFWPASGQGHIWQRLAARLDSRR